MPYPQYAPPLAGLPLQFHIYATYALPLMCLLPTHMQAPILVLIGRLGGDVSMPDGNGRTPAHVAAAAGQVGGLAGRL